MARFLEKLGMMAPGLAQGLQTGIDLRERKKDLALKDLALKKSQLELQDFVQQQQEEAAAARLLSGGKFGGMGQMGGMGGRPNVSRETMAPSGVAPQPSMQRPTAQTGWGFTGPAEGGLNTHEPHGGVSNMGVLSTSHPGMDVRHITPDQAQGVYANEAWAPASKLTQQYGGDSPLTVAVADAMENMRPTTVRKLLEASGGDVEKFLDAREKAYRAIAANDPAQQKNLAGWLNRVQKLRDYLKNLPQQGAVADSAPKAATDTGQGGGQEKGGATDQFSPEGQMRFLSSVAQQVKQLNPNIDDRQAFGATMLVLKALGQVSSLQRPLTPILTTAMREEGQTVREQSREAAAGERQDKKIESDFQRDRLKADDKTRLVGIQAQYRRELEATKAADPLKNLKASTQERTAFQRQPVVQAYEKSRQYIDSLMSADPSTVAGQVQILDAFTRLATNQAIRQFMVKSAEDNLGLTNAAEVMRAKVQSTGAVMGPEAVKQYIAAAKQMADELRANYDRAAKDEVDRLKGTGVDAKGVLGSDMPGGKAAPRFRYDPASGKLLPVQ